MIMELLTALIVGYAIGRIVTNEKSYKAGHDEGYKKGHKAGLDEVKLKDEQQYVTVTMNDGRKHKIKLEGWNEFIEIELQTYNNLYQGNIKYLKGFYKDTQEELRRIWSSLSIKSNYSWKDSNGKILRIS